MTPRECLPATWLPGMVTMRSWTSCCWQALPWTCRGASPPSMALWGALRCTLQLSMAINRYAQCQLGWPHHPLSTPLPLTPAWPAQGAHFSDVHWSLLHGYDLVCDEGVNTLRTNMVEAVALLICVGLVSKYDCICLRALSPPFSEAACVIHDLLTPIANCTVRGIDLCMCFVMPTCSSNVFVVLSACRWLSS